MLGIRVSIYGRGAGLRVCAVGGVGDFKDFLTGVQGIESNYFDFPDELRSVSGVNSTSGAFGQLIQLTLNSLLENF